MENDILYLELGKSSTLRKFPRYIRLSLHPVDYIGTITAQKKKENFLCSKSTRFSHRHPPAVSLLHESSTQRRIFARDEEKPVGHERNFFHTCLRVRKVVNEHIVNLFPPRYIENTSSDPTPVPEVTFPLYPRVVADYRSIGQQNRHRAALTAAETALYTFRQRC